MTIDAKTQAEIDKLEAETALLQAQLANKQAAEIQALIAEASFNTTRAKYYLLIVGASLFAAGAAFVKLVD